MPNNPSKVHRTHTRGHTVALRVCSAHLHAHCGVTQHAQVLQARRAQRAAQMGVLTPYTSTSDGQHIPAAHVTRAEAAQRAVYSHTKVFDPYDDCFGRTGNVVGNRMVTDAEAAVQALLLCSRGRGGRGGR